MAVPARGSRAHQRGLESVETARPRSLGGQARAGQAEHRGVAAGTAHGVQEELVVVLAVDPARCRPAWPAGRPSQPRRRPPSTLGSVGPARRQIGRRGRQRPVVEGGVVGQRGGRHVGQHRPVGALADPQAPDGAPSAGRLGDRPDDGGPDLPAPADLGHPRPVGRGDDGQHPLLALGGHDLPGLHARLAPGHGGHVDVHADPAPGRRLARWRRRGRHHRGPGCPPPAAASEQLQAGLDQALLLEGVARPGRSAAWRRRPARLVAREAGRGQHADPADAVAPGGRARAGRPGCPPPRPPRAPGARPAGRPRQSTLTSGFCGVAGVEGELAADGGHPDRVAVARDARPPPPPRASAAGRRRGGRRTAGP